jgi:hypothetical protein
MICVSIGGVCVNHKGIKNMNDDTMKFDRVMHSLDILREDYGVDQNNGGPNLVGLLTGYVRDDIFSLWGVLDNSKDEIASLKRDVESLRKEKDESISMNTCNGGTANDWYERYEREVKNAEGERLSRMEMMDKMLTDISQHTQYAKIDSLEYCLLNNIHEQDKDSVKKKISFTDMAAVVWYIEHDYIIFGIIRLRKMLNSGLKESKMACEAYRDIWLKSK